MLNEAKKRCLDKLCDLDPVSTAYCMIRLTYWVVFQELQNHFSFNKDEKIAKPRTYVFRPQEKAEEISDNFLNRGQLTFQTFSHSVALFLL